MKTAISLPDGAFQAVDACAKRLRLTRSGLLAAAVRDFVARHPGGDDAATKLPRATVANGCAWFLQLEGPSA